MSPSIAHLRLNRDLLGGRASKDLKITKGGDHAGFDEYS